MRKPKHFMSYSYMGHTGRIKIHEKTAIIKGHKGRNGTGLRVIEKSGESK
jgi:hypothetical protein